MDRFKVTLPVFVTDHLGMDEAVARSMGETLSGDYSFAEPYPHIVIDDFLPAALAGNLLRTFPVDAGAGDTRYERGYAGLHKRQVYPGHCTGEHRALFAFFNSAPMLQFLEGLTSIQGLIADPYFVGGGFHEIGTGGKLGIHADFRINEQLHLQRRLNLLIYLNKDWRPEWGGELEIWDREMKNRVHSVAPIFNRCVVFNTDATSYHGHPDALTCPPDVTRKSIALYYYTASQRIYEDVPKVSTMYQARPGDVAAIHAEARRLRAANRRQDWIPPVLFRAVRRVKDKLRGR
jgi:hypothetical protein